MTDLRASNQQIPVRFPAGAKIFIRMIGTASGTRPTSYPIGKGVLSSGLKPLGCKVEQSVPCRNDIKMAWINIFALHGGVLN